MIPGKAKAEVDDSQDAEEHNGSGQPESGPLTAIFPDTKISEA